MKIGLTALALCWALALSAQGQANYDKQNAQMKKLAYKVCGQLIDCFNEKQSKRSAPLDVYDYADCFRQVKGTDLVKILDHNDKADRNLTEFNVYDILKELDKKAYYAFAQAMVEDYQSHIALERRKFSKKTLKAQCDCYKDGVYRYGDIINSPQFIERKGTEQYEYTPVGYQKNLVGWRSPCVYTLAYDGEENRREASDFTEGDAMAVYIIPVTKDVYVYIAGRNTKVFIGHIYRMPNAPYRHIKP